ncbi:hypothetical protein EDC04DRAFT_2869690 [Pisolithus marmoratus]|nr:hypothetical protein EDC04DRAFT_2869690 [Pisolithus marmoratus]
MSVLLRLVRPTTPTVGRAYSSFFSSKPGGGRYFNSTKPPKPVVHTAKPKVDSAHNTVPGAEPNENSTNDSMNVSGSGEPSTQSQSSPPKPSNTASQPTLGVSESNHPSYSTHHIQTQVLDHPSVTEKEFKLHQFFSLYRPLLLLSQPSSTLFDSLNPSALPFSTPSDSINTRHTPFTTIDDPPESSAEADADAARQLAHALVVNRVGATMAWQHSVSRLGLSQESFVDDLISAKESAQKWVGIYADSTRRKKRKKMKKHKLKKRRRLTRAARQNAK